MRRQAEEARRLAIEGKWEQAVDINRKIIEQSHRDVDAYNRLGRALVELGRLDEAFDAYRNALSIDPSNVIAQRSIARIDQLRQQAREGAARSQPSGPVRANVFIEEVGKTYVTDLVRPASPPVLAGLTAADEVDLRIRDELVEVWNQEGQYLGQLEPKISQHLITLLNAGNRYQAFVIGFSANTIRIILREVYRNPATPAHLSLPRQAKISTTRPYLRETERLARELLESELLLEAEEEEAEEEFEAAEALEEAEEEDEEDEEFLDDSHQRDDEDENSLDS
jgi:tetratricopeptide (TPR) repeat protein